MSTPYMLTALRRGKKPPCWNGPRYPEVEQPGRLTSTEQGLNKGILYKYAGLESDVQVAVSMGFRRADKKLAVTENPHLAAKLVAHAGNVTAARIIAALVG